MQGAQTRKVFGEPSARLWVDQGGVVRQAQTGLEWPLTIPHPKVVAIGELGLLWVGRLRRPAVCVVSRLVLIRTVLLKGLMTLRRIPKDRVDS